MSTNIILSSPSSGGSSSSSQTTTTTSSSTSPDVGSSTYFAKPSGTNADASSAYDSSTDIVISGLPFSFTKYDIEKIEQIPSSGDVTVHTDKSKFTVNTVTITVSDGAFSASDTFIVTLSGPPRLENSGTSALNTFEVNPQWSRYSAFEFSDTNITATGSHYLDMSGYKGLTLEFIKDGGTDTLTFTVHASLQDDGSAADAASYQNVTQYGMTNLTGAAAASYTADALLSSADNASFKFVLLQVTTNNSAGDGDYTIRGKLFF